jgi:GH25 family lysozyme M1 (1,4-beta-N-acetylmuramidase)
MHRDRRSWLPFVVAAIAVLVVLPSLADSADAATSKWTAVCAANLRTAPKTSATIKRTIKAGQVVTAVKTVKGGRWKSKCTSNTGGRTWLKIIAINGKSVSSLYGRYALYAAYGLFKSGPNPTPTPTATPTVAPTTDVISNCSVRLRHTASTEAETASIIDENIVVTSSGTVTGGAWEADCPTTVAGSTWHRITAVGGASVASLYGVSAVYAAAGLFRAATASTGYLEGIDVSHWQGNIDWAQVKAAGKRFAIAKATEGIGFKDDRYDRNKANARVEGIAFGAYHFARPSNTEPVREADWFVDNSGYERGMIIPTLDLELTGGLGPNALTNWVKAWLQRVDERLGVKPMIYVSPSFWRSNMNDSRWFADNGYAILWVAHWGVSSPSVPGSNWGGRSWTFWQYTSDGRVPGIEGRVDLNRYRYPSLDLVTY